MNFCALLMSLTVSLNAFSKNEIVVRAHTLIEHGSPVVLGDIIDTRDLSPELQEKLSQVALAAAPKPGERLEFSNSAISSSLRTVGELPHLRIPSHVVVERSSHKWEAAVVEKELIAYWQGLCSDCRLEIERLTLPAGQLENWALTPKEELPKGGFSVPVKVVTASGATTLWVQGNLIIRKQVPVAKRAMFFGERVQTADFDWAWRDVTFAQDGVPSPEEIANRRIKSALRANDILFSGMLEHEKALRRGDIARVISGHGDWEVSVTGVAQQDGEIGDTVTIKNPKTNKDMVGVVVAKDEVEIQ